MARSKRAKRSAGGSMRDRVRKRAESHSKGQSTVVLPDGVERFDVKAGPNILSVIPYEVSVENHSEQVPVSEYWYEKTFGIHYNIGPMDRPRVCPAMTAGKPCPICEEQARLRKDPDADEDTVKALRPKERQLFNVEDPKGDPGVVQILEISYHLFGKQLEEEVQQEDDLAGFADIEGGKVIRVRFKKKKFGGNSYLEADRFDFKDRKDLSNKILEEALDLDTLVQVPSYEELKKEFEGGAVEDEDDDTGKDDDNWKKRDRVVVEIDGEDYAGVIKSIGDDEATIKFDDGDVDTYPLDDLREEEAGEDDSGGDDDSGDDDTGSGDDFDDWNFDDDSNDDDDNNEDKGSSRRCRRRG